MYSRYCLLQSLHASISTKRANLSYRRWFHSSQGGSYSCNDSRDPHTCRRRTGYCCTHLCRLLKRKREQCATSEHNHIHACTLKKCKTLKSKTNDKPSTWCWMHDFVRYILYSILKWGEGWESCLWAVFFGLHKRDAYCRSGLHCSQQCMNRCSHWRCQYTIRAHKGCWHTHWC